MRAGRRQLGNGEWSWQGKGGFLLENDTGHGSGPFLAPEALGASWTLDSPGTVVRPLENNIIRFLL